MITKLRLFLIVVSSLLIFFVSKDTTSFNLYFPYTVFSPYRCGSEVWRNFTYEDQLEYLKCGFTRYNAGTSNKTNLYATWLLNNKDWNSLSFAENDINKIKTANSNPVVVFFGRHNGTCNKLPGWKFNEFGNFVRDAVGLWELDYIEIWNEPDFQGGHPNLFGCWGSQYTTEFIDLLTITTNKVWSLYPNTKIGVSFGMDSNSLQMIESISNQFSQENRFFIGFHHYEIYPFTPSWTIEQKITEIKQVWNGEIWLTESNLRKYSSDGKCYSPDKNFQNAQALFINHKKNLEDIDVFIIYGLQKYSQSWQCTALLLNNSSPNLAYYELQSVNQQWPYP